jgi:hypothetical protein
MISSYNWLQIGPSTVTKPRPGPPAYDWARPGVAFILAGAGHLQVDQMTASMAAASIAPKTM